MLYVSLWFTFGVLYFVFNNERLPGCKPSQVLGFVDAILLSIDTQTTIGFGNYSVDSSCAHAVGILVLQCLVSILVDAAFVGLLFTKISRPQNRAASLIFSRFGCICEEGGVRYLCFRIADQRKHQLVEAHARLLLYWLPGAVPSEGADGQFVDVQMTPLSLETPDIFLLLPYIIKHRIDHTSPLFSVSLSQLAACRAEFVVLLEGSTASTSQTTQARQSYLPDEILVGHASVPCITCMCTHARARTHA